MKPKTLIPLAVVLLVLGGLVLFRRSQDKPASIQEQVNVARLLPADLEKDDIAKLELYAGPKPDEKVVLEQTETADKWVARSHFDAPVKTDTLTGYLEKLTKLQGEFRAEATGEDALKSYELTDESGFHIKGYKKGAESPAFHLIVGKSPKYGNVFVRAADANTVYVSDVDFRRDAGVYGEERDDAPEPGTWLDKQVLDIPRDKIKRVAMTMPDKEIVFEEREKPRPEPEPAEETDKAENKDEATPPPPPEYEWVVSIGGYEGTAKESGINSVLTKISNLTATDIDDPSKKAEWKLDPPMYVARVKLEGQNEDLVIEGGRPDPTSVGYVRVAGREADVVYKLSKYNFEQLFPKGSSLYDLPQLNIDTQKVNRIVTEDEKGTIVLAKEGEEWRVEQPKCDLPIIGSRVSGIAAAVARWRAEDYADSMQGKGLETPAKRVTFTTTEGESHAIEVGAPSQHFDGFYAKLDGRDRALAITQADVKKIWVTPREIFNLSLFDLNEDDIDAVEITRDGKTVTLDRLPERWKLTSGTETFTAKGEKVDDLLVDIVDLEGEDVIFGDARVQGGLWGSIRLRMKDGAEHRLNVEIEQEGKHPVTVSGKQTAFLIAKDTIEALFPSLDDLKEPEPEAPAEPEVVVDVPSDAPETAPADEPVNPAPESQPEMTPEAV